MACHRLGEQVVERGDVGESARTFERLEEVIRGDVGKPLVGVELEEFLAGGGTAQTAQDAELAVVDVGESGAAVLPGGAGIEGEDVGEEPR